MAIDVNFYDAKHREALSNTPQFANIVKIVESGLTVDEDLWIYCLFKEQKARDGFRTYADFASRLAKRLQLFEDYINLQSKTITSVDDKPEKIISEYVGIGCALKLVSEIHGLTEADWELIPESRTKDLDFFISSDSTSIIEVECKGTFSGSSRSSMKADIEAKKRVQRTKQNNNHLLYGIITSYFSDPAIPARADILDPDPVEVYEDPYYARLLCRMKYYLIQFNVFSRAHFLISLSERVNGLRYNKEYMRLDAAPLVGRFGEPFKSPISFNWKRPFENHSEIIGDIFSVDKETYLFYGLTEAIVDILISQSFGAILGFRTQPNTVSVTATIEGPPEQQVERKSESIILKGDLRSNSAGRFIGLMHKA